MAHRLGSRQIRRLFSMGASLVQVVGDRETRRLCELGLMSSDAEGNFARITPAGLRALADAAAAGRIDLTTPTRSALPEQPAVPRRRADRDRQRPRL